MRCLFLWILFAAPCVLARFDVSGVEVVSGLAARLKEIFPAEADLAVQKAVADGLVRALGDEAMDIKEVTCNRDYSQLCPAGWADAGDGTKCAAPKDYQGRCKPKLKWGGLTAQQKRQQAARCAAPFPCIGQCMPDFSQNCPLGWPEDVNRDCLAPAGYSGRCVLRKSFSGMKKIEKQKWARACDVSWPCRKTLADSRELGRMRVKGIFNSDCVADYSQACPEHHALKGEECVAKEGFSGICGLAVSSQYSAAEKAAYADACLTPWPCASL